MATGEHALDKKVYCLGITYDNVFKMRKFFGMGKEASVAMLIDMMCDELFKAVKLSAKEQREIAAEIENNRRLREERRNRWAQTETSRKDAAWRKARYSAKKAQAAEKKGGAE